jgi:hypothetical protein
VKQAVGWAFGGLGLGKDLYELFLTKPSESLEQLANDVASDHGVSITDPDAHLVGHFAADGHVVVDGIFGIMPGNVPRNIIDAIKFTVGMQTDGGAALVRLAQEYGPLEFTEKSLVESQGTMFFAELSAAGGAVGGVTLRAVTYQAAFSFALHGIPAGLSVAMQSGANDFLVSGMLGGVGLAKSFAALAGIPYETQAYGLGFLANHMYDASPSLGSAKGITVHNGF